MISKVKVQEKIKQRLKFKDFNNCPNILYADADADADAGGIAIALLHLSAIALKMGLTEMKIEIVFGCRNRNNLLIHQDLFF